MKSPRLLIIQLLLCPFLFLFFTSCGFQNIDELPKQKFDGLEEENPGSEVFEEEFLEDVGFESGLNLALNDNILHKISFEESNPFSTVSSQFCCNHSRKVVLNPTNSNDKVGRFELRNTDRVETATTTSARAEILFPSQKNKERWYAVSVYFPTTGYSKDRVTEIIMQWHQSANSPPSAVEVKDDQIFLRSINRNSKLNSDEVYTNHPIATVQRGQWNEFIFHFIHSPYSDGLIEIWHNGKKLNPIKGPNIRSGLSLPRFKVGIYKWKWNNGRTSDTSKRILYVNNILIANENASLEDLKNANSTMSNPSSNDTEGSDTISSFSLIDTNKNTVLGIIKNGSIIVTNTERLSITANMPSNFTGKVAFKLTGTRTKTQTESISPYSLFGDQNGNYEFGFGLPKGKYTLTATPINGNIQGISKTINFEFIN
jgi:hypothetical protein